MSLRLNYSLVEKVFWPDEESRTSCYRTNVVYEIFAVTRHCSANPRMKSACHIARSWTETYMASHVIVEMNQARSATDTTTLRYLF